MDSKMNMTVSTRSELQVTTDALYIPSPDGFLELTYQITR